MYTTHNNTTHNTDSKSTYIWVEILNSEIATINTTHNKYTSICVEIHCSQLTIAAAIQHALYILHADRMQVIFRKKATNHRALLQKMSAIAAAIQQALYILHAAPTPTTGRSAWKSILVRSLPYIVHTTSTAASAWKSTIVKSQLYVLQTKHRPSRLLRIFTSPPPPRTSPPPSRAHLAAQRAEESTCSILRSNESKRAPI